MNQFQLFHEACRLNNEGASFLATHDSGSAIKALKGALLIMERVSQQAAQLTSANKESECLFVEIPGLEDTFFIYNRFLLLEGSDASDLAFCNAIILFNLALTFHQRGNSRCQDAKLMRRAAYFYDLTARLVAGDTFPVNSNYSALLVAALNNQAQIHQELLEFDQALILMDQVNRISGHILLPSSNSSSAIVCNYFDSDGMDEILLNAAIVREPTTAASA